jgi:hypothetical protein
LGGAGEEEVIGSWAADLDTVCWRASEHQESEHILDRRARGGLDPLLDADQGDGIS